MSVDYNRTSKRGAPPESETPMFAGTPVWERGKKARGARRSMFQDTDAAAGGATTVTREATRETVTGPNGDDAPFVAPATRTTVRRQRSMAPTAIAVGLVALAGLAAAGYYATRPADTTLTPGAPATSIAAAPATTSTTTTTSLAANTPPDSAAAEAARSSAAPAATSTTTRSVTTTRTARPARTHSSSTVTATPERPVTLPSATSAGVNTATSTSVGAAPSPPATAAAPPAAGPAPVTTMPPPAATPAPSATTPDVTPPAASTAPSSTTPPQ